MKKITLLLLTLSTASVFAKTPLNLNSKFVVIRPGVKLYVESYPAAPGRPTLFLANGLTYSTRQYEPFVRALRDLDPGLGIVTYDMQGMGRTLLDRPESRRERIPIEQQVRDLRALKRALGITGPASVAGLSYGGAVESLYSTMYPGDFDNFIAFAPMIERLPEQDQLIQTWVNAHKILYPLDPRNDDELYDYYLRIWIYNTFPAAEPIILQNQYKLEAVFRMVQGVKNWNAFEHAEEFPAGKIHIIAAVNDEHVKIRRLDELWNAIPVAARASYLRLDKSKHKIPEIWPRELAAWVLHILNNNPHLKSGLTFEGDPVAKEALSGNIRIPLKVATATAQAQESFCESILRAVP